MFYFKVFLVSLFPILYAFTANSDCLLLYGSITWEKIDNNSILIYKSGKPYAKVDLEYGTFLTSFTDLKIIDDSPCSYSSDVFLVDGDTVDVRSIDKF